ncbi:hypothetical protein MKY34_19815 [Sporosarcina sp. FSL K6-1522]|uniref:hypothetical protein n=1 Tax=Sporosarcina sp. FSL K6-1522 TaxID=2921554 RepID=UPI003159EA2B
MTESFYVYETQVKPIRKLEVAGGGVMKLEKFKFGDIIENGWAGEKSPYRVAIFVRHKKGTIEMTNGKGEFWETVHDRINRNTRLGSIFENLELLEVAE